jgi:epoxide hydrolase
MSSQSDQESTPGPQLSIKPFRLSIPESELVDLRRRLLATRWPNREAVRDWSQGAPLEVVRDLCDYWIHHYDWRRCEAWFNSFPQYKASIDGEEIHLFHIRSRQQDALPLLLLHGWPGSVLEFHKVIEPLIDPTAHQGTRQDSFHVIIPSLPGYGWSSQPSSTGWNLKRMAKAMVALMELLGYQQWVAQGGDWGADICAVLASDNPPKSLLGIHMNTPFFDARKEIRSPSNPSTDELKAKDKEEAFEKHESGYFKQQATRPQTIGYALADSPIAQAAWIYEKIYSWTEHSGDLETVLFKDEILDNIMVYWLSNSGASSARLYWEDDDSVALPIDIPVGMSVFPGDLVYAPRQWGELYFTNIVHWRDVERGGHFAAWEVPDLFVRELRECFRKLRALPDG